MPGPEGRRDRPLAARGAAWRRRSQSPNHSIRTRTTGPIASIHVSDRVIQIWSDDQLREVCDYFDSIGVSYDLVIV